ncbi:apolipoprotein N-acyltransferase [Pedobacter sp. UBA4863]|uniref:apolipoprotein N-acyltransferase n=1 Tax=Pedobacter sp. UBA4863 TaxID=1947060 RepID=UPI0025E05EF5|nr:apolipoprotein N-acyltransferase [Pedobacter sp. UBA4863]
MPLKNYQLTTLSSILVIVSLFYLQPLLSLVALVPLMYAIKQQNLIQTGRSVVLFATIFSLFFFAWLPQSAKLFGNNMGYGLLASVVGLMFMVLYFAVLITSTNKLAKQKPTGVRILILASLTIIFEYAKDAAFYDMPWLDFHFGNALMGSVYTIQFAEFGGIYLLSFMVIVINGLIAEAIVKPKLRRWALGCVAFFLCCNLGIYHYRSAVTSNSAPISLNLLTANIKPGVNWEYEGNAIVQNLLSLNKSAARSPANFNVWTESVVPWTYQPNDDFIKLLLNENQPSGAITLLGINTAVNKDKVFDSAYLLNPNGKILGTYHKNKPLAILEKPKFGLLLNARDLPSVQPSQISEVMTTPLAKIGVYICNEATIASTAIKLVNGGADFLINISNDAWFSNTYIVKQHFYYNKLRAVSLRRDVVVNSNLGYKGSIAANGDTNLYAASQQPEMNSVSVVKRFDVTLYANFPYLPLILSSILLLTLIFFRR